MHSVHILPLISIIKAIATCTQCVPIFPNCKICTILPGTTKFELVSVLRLSSTLILV